MLGVVPTEFDTEAIPSANTKGKLKKLMHDLTQVYFVLNCLFFIGALSRLLGVVKVKFNTESIPSGQIKWKQSPSLLYVPSVLSVLSHLSFVFHLSCLSRFAYLISGFLLTFF